MYICILLFKKCGASFITYNANMIIMLVLVYVRDVIKLFLIFV